MTLRRLRALAFHALVGACGSTPPSGPEPSIGGAAELSREDWLSYSRRSLRRETCASGSRFRRCSEVDRHRCEQQMTAALAVCNDAYRTKLPPRIHAGEEDRRARDQVTGCMWHHAAMALGPVEVDMLCLLSSR